MDFKNKKINEVRYLRQRITDLEQELALQKQDQKNLLYF